MRLVTAISIYSGGPGSGCNPEAAEAAGTKCGRKSTGKSTQLLTDVSRATVRDLAEIKSWLKPEDYEDERMTNAAEIAANIAYDKALQDTYLFRSRSGRIVGAMELDPEAEPDAVEVKFLATHPDIIAGKWNIKGVGTTLMLQAAKVAAALNKGLVLVSLPSASGFYKKLGMRGTGSVYRWSPQDVKTFAGLKNYA